MGCRDAPDALAIAFGADLETNLDVDAGAGADEMLTGYADGWGDRAIG